MPKIKRDLKILNERLLTLGQKVRMFRHKETNNRVF